MMFSDWIRRRYCSDLIVDVAFYKSRNEVLEKQLTGCQSRILEKNTEIYQLKSSKRELENTIERALILSQGKPLAFNWLERGGVTGTLDGGHQTGGQDYRPLEETAEAPRKLDAVVAAHIRRALLYTGGKVGGPDGAARLLGVNSSTLRHRMRKLGIPFGRQ